MFTKVGKSVQKAAIVDKNGHNWENKGKIGHRVYTKWAKKGKSGQKMGRKWGKVD